MKRLLLLCLLSVSTLTFAQDLKLPEYDFKLTDITTRGFTPESFFSKIDRSFVKLGSSICSNRALIWANNFKTQDKIDSAKIFLFYTKKTGEVGLKTWWYHVAPVVNVKGKQVVMDAGFPAKIKGPQTRDEWLHSFIGSTNCKEIKAKENELIERMFSSSVFPSTTEYGTFDCYYRVVPGPLWTPEQVAMDLLQADSNGRPVRFERSEINKNDLFQACIEATTTKFDRMFGGGKKQCEEYVNRY